MGFSKIQTDFVARICSIYRDDVKLCSFENVFSHLIKYTFSPMF